MNDRAKLNCRFHFSVSEDFEKRLMRAVGRLGSDQSTFCREACELYLRIVEQRSELHGLDLLVFLRDQGVRIAAVLNDADPPPAPAIPDHRSLAPARRTTRAPKRS